MILGDFNVDLDRNEDNTYDRKCLAVMTHEELLQRGLVQMIKVPTHTYQNKKSKIDLIFTSEPRKIEDSGTIQMGSDHECIFVVRRSKYIQRSEEITKRSFRNFNIDALLDEAREVTWEYQETTEVVNIDDDELDNRVMDLEEKIRTLFDKHAPVKIFKISKNKVSWITKELVEQIETKNNLKRNLMQRGGSSEDWNRWKQLRNKINRDLKQA